MASLLRSTRARAASLLAASFLALALAAPSAHAAGEYDLGNVRASDGAVHPTACLFDQSAYMGYFVPTQFGPACRAKQTRITAVTSCPDGPGMAGYRRSGWYNGLTKTFYASGGWSLTSVFCYKTRG